MSQVTMGKMIRAARDDKGWNQSELGERLKVSQQSIAKWEGDICLPRRSSLSNLAEVFDIPIEAFRYARDASTLHAQANRDASMGGEIAYVSAVEIGSLLRAALFVSVEDKDRLIRIALQKLCL